MSDYYLEVRAIKKHFYIKPGLGEKKVVLKAVEGVTIGIKKGETVGLVGESGCGKTTVSRVMLLLEKPTAGTVYFNQQDVAQFNKQALKDFRRSIQPVFQNPYSALDPRMRIDRIVSEPLRVSTSLSESAVSEKVITALETVGLKAPDAKKFPHEFSGGQRQRIAIARALASNPQVIVLDEAVSSQDISIQAQILNLLKELQQETGVSYLFVAHDLATVRYLSHRVYVMYLGRVVENSDSDELYDKPLHPYTQALLAACLPDDPDIKSEPVCMDGEMASPLNPPRGCSFHPRCPHMRPECKEVAPPLTEAAPNHWVACFLYQ